MKEFFDSFRFLQHICNAIEGLRHELVVQSARNRALAADLALAWEEREWPESIWKPRRKP